MEDTFRIGLEYFFPGKCYDTVVDKHELFDGESPFIIVIPLYLSISPFSPVQCLKMAYSRLLSLTVITGALIGRFTLDSV